MDYSNTIFYKICCIDPSINDLYIGHTTNFVQRRYAHKQGCNNVKSANYKCKLYKVIRENNGWDNWEMDIIAFHKCDNLLGAKTQEQKYFEEYKATLNSIEPLPKSKPKIVNDVAKKEKIIYYCNKCNIHFHSSKTQEVHNTTRKHIQKSDIVEKVTYFKNPKYSCEICDYHSGNKKDYNKHIQTNKHIQRNTTEIQRNTTEIQPASYRCVCGKTYKHRASLYNHKKKMCNGTIIDNSHIETNDPPPENKLIAILLQQNTMFQDLILKSEEEKKELILKTDEQRRKTDEEKSDLQNQMMEMQKHFIDAIKDGTLANKVITVE
jgi:hypothetical protein